MEPLSFESTPEPSPLYRIRGLRMMTKDLDSYTPGRIWEILQDGEDIDEDEFLDVQVGLTHLPPNEATFIIRLGQGYTGEQAMSESGLKGNQTRLKQGILMKLTEIINGGK